jgi:hypothetical protein
MGAGKHDMALIILGGPEERVRRFRSFGSLLEPGQPIQFSPAAVRLKGMTAEIKARLLEAEDLWNALQPHPADQLEFLRNLKRES